MRTNRLFLILAISTFCTLGRAIPPHLDLTTEYGVDIHRSLLYPGDLARIRSTGFKWVRVDLNWRNAERTRNVFDFTFFDVLANGLKAQGLRAVVVLAYGNPLYADFDDSSQFLSRIDSKDFRDAYVAFSAAAVAHFSGRGFIWEQWNEPNNKHFWPPAPNSESYIDLMKRACMAIHEKSPNEIIIGPAVSYVDLPFIEACLRGGMLNYWSGISVHPYRQTEPEGAAKDYAELRALIARYALPGQTVPIICGEWGYSTAWKGYDDFKQADYITRMFQVSRKERIPLTIWYDWRNDGDDPAKQEHNFGLVRQAPGGLFEPRPAYFAALKEMETPSLPQ
jgi:hypothetical protein